MLVHVPDTMPPAPPPSKVKEWHNDEPMKPVCYVVGVDLGQSRDFSTICVNEVNFTTRVHFQQAEFEAVAGEARREKIAHHRLRHVERIPLGTSYPGVLDRITEVISRLGPLPRPVELVMDATGVGRPVMDLARKEGLNPLGVTITAGSDQKTEGRNARVAKKILASTVAVALDTGRLQVVAVGPAVEVLKGELRAFRVKIGANQNESFESWREKDHDDLVLAAAMAVWAGERLKRDRVRIDPTWRYISR